MKLNSVIGVLAATSTINAFSLFESLKPLFLNPEVVVINEPKEPIFKLSGPGSDRADIVEIWNEIEHTMSPSAIHKLVNNFEDKTVKSSLLKNVFNGFIAGFETIQSNVHSDHILRIKENNPELLGLDTVKQYTGYLDVLSLDKHFFYWFFESRNDPKNDPIILWLNGGPGCSSATGLFFELGPSLINATYQPNYNPYSWNSNASVIFLDQPVGVGYSYTNGEQIRSTASASKDVYVFLELFFQKFPEFIKNDFHIAGESYAGHYIPNIATEIISNADRSFELTTVLIGNGITNSLIQDASYKPMGCGEGGYKAVLDESTCSQMERDYPKCATLIDLCYKFQNALTCIPAEVYCNAKLFGPYQETGLNVYDIRVPCSDQGGLCYEEMGYIEEYLNLDWVKKAVGATVDIFSSCDDKVFANFIKDGDGSKPFHHHVIELLEKNIPVLIYAGDKDYICNWLGNHAWTDALEYSGHDSFQAAPLKPWFTKGEKLAGEVKNYKHFTFLRVYDAGHMVPYDQPENSLDFFNRWIGGEYALGY